MDDETLMQHFESFHAGDLAMEFRPEPERTQRRLASSSAWNAYHDTLHRLWPEKYDHDHKEETDDMAAPPNEKIYVITDGNWEDIRYAEMRMPGGLLDGQSMAAIELHRPDLRPIYGGPTLLEALWSEMDAIMDRLMTGNASGEDVCSRSMEGCTGDPDQAGDCGHADNGDKYRAQELAWVLAIVTDPYEPSVDKIRAETMRRWEAAEAEANAQEDALDPDQEQHQFDAAGVNGYEL